MTIKIERNTDVWTIHHLRPEARNAMDPKSADDLVEAFKVEWANGLSAIRNEGFEGAGRFSDGAGRHGDFENI